jgi:SAM-dependent methyltransferase
MGALAHTRSDRARRRLDVQPLSADRPALRVDLLITTLEPEPQAFTERRVSYLYADLRDLPLRDDFADTVLCVSVLEHVGMDNVVFGAAVNRAKDPDSAARCALDELGRVCRPDGRILLTVPYGRAMDMGWQRQFDDRLLDGLDATVTVFEHDVSGWRGSSVQAAADCTYDGRARGVLRAEIAP